MKIKILITGGIGYVGTELSKVLSLNKNYDITIIDNRFVPERVKWLVENNIKFYERDIFNIEDLVKKSDLIYHLAGITQVPIVPSQENETNRAEIIKYGTEATRKLIKDCPSDSKIIFASTQVVYDGLKEEKFDLSEDDIPPNPLVAYSQSKRQSEIDLLESNKNFIIARFASVYGYNENMRWKILPNLFSKMTASSKDLKVFGPNNLKPLIGINDLANLLDYLSISQYNKDIFHCVGEHKTVLEIAKICKFFDESININTTNDETPNKGFSLSNQKVLNTGFKFKQDVKTEIGKMIKYWKNNE